MFCINRQAAGLESLTKESKELTDDTLGMFDALHLLLG